MIKDPLREAMEKKARSDQGESMSYCFACKQPLPPHSMFCPSCGPPHPPEENPEEGLTAGQVFVRVAVLFLFFGVILVYKLDIDMEGLISEVSEKVRGPVVVEPPSEDQDYKLINMINVSQANVRERATTRSKVVTVLTRGTEVEVIEKQGNWSKIRFNGATGWISNKLLTTEVR